MYPRPGEVLHFSHDPNIAVFRPHVAMTAATDTAYVWAVGADRAADYWFPRECPRVLAWALPTSSAADLALLAGRERVHAVERRSLAAMRDARLYAYRLPAASFAAYGEFAHARVSSVEVTPLGPPEPVGDLVALHAAAGIELRAVDDLRPLVERWSHTTLGFSAIRLRNARPAGGFR